MLPINGRIFIGIFIILKMPIQLSLKQDAFIFLSNTELD